jgi:hypothetical protein
MDSSSLLLDASIGVSSPGGGSGLGGGPPSSGGDVLSPVNGGQQQQQQVQIAHIVHEHEEPRIIATGHGRPFSMVPSHPVAYATIFGEWGPRDPCAAALGAVLNFIPGLGTLFFGLTKGSCMGGFCGILQLLLSGTAFGCLGYFASPVSDDCYGVSAQDMSAQGGGQDDGWCCAVVAQEPSPGACATGGSCTTDSDCSTGYQCAGQQCVCQGSCVSSHSGQCAFDPVDQVCHATDLWSAVDVNGAGVMLLLAGSVAVLVVWIWSW